jgi:hypothetical protein
MSIPLKAGLTVALMVKSFYGFFHADNQYNYVNLSSLIRHVGRLVVYLH